MAVVIDRQHRGGRLVGLDLRRVGNGKIRIEKMNADRRAVGWKLNAIVDIFAAVVGSKRDAGGTDNVVANLSKCGGGAFAVVSVYFVVVGIIPIAVFCQDVPGGACGRQNAGVLFQHDRVVNAREIKAGVPAGLRIHVVVLEQSVCAVQVAHRGVAVNSVGSSSRAQSDVVVFDVRVADAGHIDHF